MDGGDVGREDWVDRKGRGKGSAQISPSHIPFSVFPNDLPLLPNPQHYFPPRMSTLHDRQRPFPLPKSPTTINHRPTNPLFHQNRHFPKLLPARAHDEEFPPDVFPHPFRRSGRRHVSGQRYNGQQEPAVPDGGPGLVAWVPAHAVHNQVDFPGRVFARPGFWARDGVV